MTTLTANHEKVAWAWLNKLMQRAQRPRKVPDPANPSEVPPAVRMSPRAREAAIVDAYEATKKMLMRAIRSEIGPIQRAERQFAQKAGLDPLYFNWFLINGKNWGPMPKKTNMALRAIQNIYMWHGAVPNHWNNKIIPDMSQGRYRDRAMVDFGNWFLRNVVPKIERKYVREIWKQSQDLVKEFRGSNAPRDPTAAKLFMRDFEKRLVADRFQEKPAVQEVVDLFS